MSRWRELPGDGPNVVWRGPTENQGGAMREVRGLVVHIAEGYYEGTIAWQRNASSNVSSHFIVAKDGRIAQMVDTDVTAWTQRAGNGHWLSAEFEGFVPDSLTAAQLHACARLLLKAHHQYGVPLAVASKPDHRGLGHHSMGGAAWGHLACPGAAIMGQKPGIIARAKTLAAPAPPPAPSPPAGGHFPILDLIGGDDMRPYTLIRHKDGDKPEVFALFGSGAVRHIGAEEMALLRKDGDDQVPFLTTGSVLEWQRLKDAASVWLK